MSLELQRRERVALSLLAAASLAIVAAGVASHVRGVHCRSFVDQLGGTNLECRISWRAP
jgi:hypothetical protein